MLSEQYASHMAAAWFQRQGNVHVAMFIKRRDRRVVAIPRNQGHCSRAQRQHGWGTYSPAANFTYVSIKFCAYRKTAASSASLTTPCPMTRTTRLAAAGAQVRRAVEAHHRYSIQSPAMPGFFCGQAIGVSLVTLKASHGTVARKPIWARASSPLPSRVNTVPSPNWR